MKNCLPNLIIVSVVFTLLHSITHAVVPSQFERKPDEWLRRAEGRRITGNVVTWQSSNGSWPKNTDTATKPYEGDSKKIRGTFDNGATVNELRFLARAFNVTEDSKIGQAFQKGLNHILEAQYPTGGWPQYYPPSSSYHRHITFNDNSMVRIMEFLRDVEASSEFAFLDAGDRDTAKHAFDKGIDCILASQIIVDGKRTVWCAQHDELDLRPRSARSYELESLSGSESVSILKLLMSLKQPSPEVKRAIESGVRWFESAKIKGIRVAKDAQGNRIVVNDPNASPVWARFYDIETGQPFFCGRDGIKKERFAEIEVERRNGYSWYGGWGRDLAKQHEAWKKRVEQQ